MPAVVVLCLNKRRKTIKFPASYTVYQILDQVCKKEHLNPDDYELRSNAGALDKSLQWAFTNLPNNAKLELHPAKNEQLEGKPVTIALQLEGGERLQANFQTTSSLKDVVDHFGAEIIEGSEAAHHAPVIIYMRHEVMGWDLLSKTTLGGLGISGRALLRFKFVPSTEEDSGDAHATGKEEPSTSHNNTTDVAAQTVATAAPSIEKIETECSDAILVTTDTAEPTILNSENKVVDSNASSKLALSESNQQQGTSKKDVSDSSETTIGTPNSTVTPANTSANPVQDDNTRPSEQINIQPQVLKKDSSDSPSVLKKLKITKGDVAPVEQPTTSRAPAMQLDRLSEPCDRQPVLYHESTIPETVNNDVADEFFKVTVTDLRMMISDLKRQQSEEESLLIGAQRDQRRAALIMKYPQVLVRVVFPTRHVLQGWFQPLETVGVLYDYVAMHIKKSDFYLFTAPPKNVLNQKNQTLYDCGLSPASKVFWGSSNMNFAETDIRDSAMQHFSTFEEANGAISKAYHAARP